MTEPGPEYSVKNEKGKKESVLFPGFVPPTSNWSPLPHILISSLSIIDSLAELKVVLYVLRHTWGWMEHGRRITQRRLSIDEFENGRKKKGGGRMDDGTGMSAPAIRAGIRKAIEHGFLAFDEDARDAARIKRFYRLNMQEEGSLTPEEENGLPPKEKGFTLEMPQGENGLPPQKNDFTPIIERNSLETKGEKPEKETFEVSGDALLDQFLGPRPERVLTHAAPNSNWADPVQAGGADSQADALVDAACRFNGLSQGSAALPEKKRKQLTRRAGEILQEWGGGTVGQVRLAWQAWTVRCGWHKQADLFYDSFASEFGMLLLAVRDGTVTAETLREEAEAGSKRNGGDGNGRGGGGRRPQSRERGRWTAEDAERLNAQAAAELGEYYD